MSPGTRVACLFATTGLENARALACGLVQGREDTYRHVGLVRLSGHDQEFTAKGPLDTCLIISLVKDQLRISKRIINFGRVNIKL